MENSLLISNSIYYVKEEINKLSSLLTMKDFNFLEVNEKLELENLIDGFLMTMPFGDSFKLLVFDISLYTKSELKSIFSAIKNSFNVVIGVYYVKDKLDKLDNSTKKLFEDNNFKIKNFTTINNSIVRGLLKERNLLDININLFSTHDNMDVVINDINKIAFLDKSIISSNEVSYYLSESFDANIFELINYIVEKDVDKALMKLRLLIVKEKPYLLNLLILKHMILLRLVKQGLSDNEIALRESFSGGKGKPINSYRLSLLKKSKPKINLDFAIDELLKNDKNKTFDLEISLLKIFSK